MCRKEVFSTEVRRRKDRGEVPAVGVPAQALCPALPDTAHSCGTRWSPKSFVAYQKFTFNWVHCVLTVTISCCQPWPAKEPPLDWLPWTWCLLTHTCPVAMVAGVSSPVTVTPACPPRVPSPLLLVECAVWSFLLMDSFSPCCEKLVSFHLVNLPSHRPCSPRSELGRAALALTCSTALTYSTSSHL